MKQTVVLAILDGWGIGAKNDTNPIFVANPEHINYIKSHFPSGSLQASGIAVGLPWDEEGNSEVGHLTIGAGKVIYQHYPKITLAIRNKSFFSNPVLKEAIARVKSQNSALNLVGILSSGNVHASLEHLKALIKCAEAEGVAQIKLHLFSDGKDSPPKSLLKLLQEIPPEKLASISGRYYAMDRDMRWERTEKTYNTLVGKTAPVTDYLGAIKGYFAKDLSEEFIEPMLVGDKAQAISANDAVIFFNFREDSMRQIAASFMESDFDHFERQDIPNLFIATMTTYSDKFNVPALFPTEKIENPLAKVLADSEKIQLHIAETEKYAHVTYFFNGYRDTPFKNEYRILIPSRNVPRHDDHPEMMAEEITSRVVQAIGEGIFDFILVNFANPDIIAHTGNFEAGLKTIAVTDKCIGELTKKVMETNSVMIVTADHGNIEQMVYPLTGVPETEHDTSRVPIYLVAKEYERPHDETEINEREKNASGIISDIAPTVLELLNLPAPEEMSGRSLLRLLTLG